MKILPNVFRWFKKVPFNVELNSESNRPISSHRNPFWSQKFCFAHQKRTDIYVHHRARTKVFVLVIFVLYQPKIKVWSTFYKVQVKYLYLEKNTRTYTCTSEKKVFCLYLKVQKLVLYTCTCKTKQHVSFISEGSFSFAIFQVHLFCNTFSCIYVYVFLLLLLSFLTTESRDSQHWKFKNLRKIY